MMAKRQKILPGILPPRRKNKDDIRGVMNEKYARAD
jgi:hypothetical protein